MRWFGPLPSISKERKKWWMFTLLGRGPSEGCLTSSGNDGAETGTVLRLACKRTYVGATHCIDLGPERWQAEWSSHRSTPSPMVQMVGFRAWSVLARIKIAACFVLCEPHHYRQWWPWNHQITTSHHSLLSHSLHLGAWTCLPHISSFRPGHSLLPKNVYSFVDFTLPRPKIHFPCKIKWFSKAHSPSVLTSKLQTLQHYHRQISLLKMPLNIDSFTWLRKLPCPRSNFEEDFFPYKA